MATSALVALDATIIATAVPSIVEDVGGFSQFPWLFSVYLLAQAVTVPVYGKLADVYGRRPVIVFGLGLFLVGSVLCGVAWSMPALIVFRLVQGLGAGAVQPIGITIAGDQFGVRERGRVQAYLAAVWATCSVAGPTLGGLFAEYLSWRWIFFVNVPICLLAGGLLLARLREVVEPRRLGLDYGGAAALTAGSALLVLGLLEGGQAWAWQSAPGIAIPAAGLVLLGGFVWRELRAPDPVLPMWVLTRRLLLTCNLCAAGVGAIIFGLITYVPTFAQEILGAGPLSAGLTLATLTLGWAVSASQAARLYLRFGFGVGTLTGAAVTMAGCAALLAVGVGSSVGQVAATGFVIGLGVGLVLPTTLVAAQSSVQWNERGVVTATSLLCRSLGSAIGVAVFSAIANATYAGGAEPSRQALSAATHQVFVAVAVIAVGVAAAAAAMPRGRLTDQAAVHPPSMEKTDPVM
jgi:MFS family permease